MFDSLIVFSLSEEETFHGFLLYLSSICLSMGRTAEIKKLVAGTAQDCDAKEACV